LKPFGIIDVGAFFILGKRAPGFFFITVNLPTTAAFTAVSLMKNEAANVLGRIAEKQSDIDSDSRRDREVRGKAR